MWLVYVALSMRVLPAKVGTRGRVRWTALSVSGSSLAIERPESRLTRSPKGSWAPGARPGVAPGRAAEGVGGAFLPAVGVGGGSGPGAKGLAGSAGWIGPAGGMGSTPGALGRRLELMPRRGEAVRAKSWPSSVRPKPI